MVLPACRVFLAFAFPITAVFAQDTAPPPPVLPPPVTGEPLPPFKLNGTISIETGKNGEVKTVFTDRPVFTIGDIRLEADRMEVSYSPLQVEASGNVLLKRGDEELRGTSFLLQGDKGIFDAQGATAISPPFYIRAETITRIGTKGSNEFRARNARVTPSTSGRGEFGIKAEEVRFINEKRVVLRNATLYLWNNRLLTIRRLSFSANSGGNRDRPTGEVPPVSFRSSRISGLALGAGINFVPGPNITGSFQVEATTKQGFQYNGHLRAELFSYFPQFEPRRITAIPGGVDPKLVNASPLRQLLAARALPPKYNSLLDFETILLTQTPVSRPVRAAGRDVHLEFNVSGRREIGTRRQGPLLLSKFPETALIARFPLRSEALRTNDNAAGLSFLRRLRPYILSDLTLGKYEEERLGEDSIRIKSTRLGASLGIGTMPMLVGDSLLLYGQLIHRVARYQDDRTYGFTETTVAGSYVLGERTAVGLSYTERTQSGSTPFFWDQIDTRSEAQPFVQFRFPKGKYTLALLGRYDMRQQRLFDSEIALAIRGKNLEPRISYRSLNSQLNFGVAVLGISTR